MSKSGWSMIALLAWTVPIFADETNLAVPPGFKVTKFADHTLANDIYSMTLDDQGRVLVSGRGWVKLLEDIDGDGKADRATITSETKTGAMGMYWDTGFLYISADDWFARAIPKLPLARRATGGPKSIPPISDDPPAKPLPKLVGGASTGDDAIYFSRPTGWSFRFEAARQNQTNGPMIYLAPSLDILQRPQSAVDIVIGGVQAPIGISSYSYYPPAGPNIARLAIGERGGHGIRKGPDGRFYLIGGNDAVFNKLAIDPGSPIQKPQLGCLVRFSKDLRNVEIVAQGFFNPRRFDFTPRGDIITFDGVPERDPFMPWHAPARLFQVAHGQHHGWLTPGDRRSLARCDYYPDAVDVMTPLDGGTATGVVCYRHVQFPVHYQGGFFAMDWTTGKIWHLPVQRQGSTCITKPELFLHPVGTNGFAPTDACVAPDGSLLVSTGGRGTLGSIYRIEYVGLNGIGPDRYAEPTDDLDKVLKAPQPLDAWSRARWEPVARKLGQQVFYDAFLDPKRSIDQRIRALEVTNDVFNGVTQQVAKDAFAFPHPDLLARLAWSLGRDFPAGGEEVLLDLAKFGKPAARTAALDSIGDLLKKKLFQGNQARFAKVLAERLADDDKRVRMAASRIVVQMPYPAWRVLSNLKEEGGLRFRLQLALGEYWNKPSSFTFLSEHLNIALEGLLSEDITIARDSLRLLMLIDGDWRLRNQADEYLCAYSLQNPRSETRYIDKRIREQIRELFPSGDKNFDREATRYLAMVEDDDSQTIAKVLAQFTKASTAVEDIHHLIVLSQLKGKSTPEQSKLVVDALFGVTKEIGGTQGQSDQGWASRLGGLILDLRMRYPKMGELMLKHPELARAANIPFLTSFSPEDKIKAARLFLAAARKDAKFAWTPEMVDLVSLLPAAEYRPVFRERWSDSRLRDAMLRYLVENPVEEDRALFLDGLDSAQQVVVLDCIAVLKQLHRDAKRENIVRMLKRLRLSAQEPAEATIRERLLDLVQHQGSVDLKVKETTGQPSKLKQEHELLFAWFDNQYPTEAAVLRGDERNAEHWRKVLAAVSWEKGNAERGAIIFRERSCVACHTGSNRLGPNLSDLGNRVSRDDLFAAIVYPSRNVAPAYRVNDFETLDGNKFSGMVLSESPDLFIQLDAVNTVRVEPDNIVSRQPSRKSFMPGGLLKDLKPADLADLYAYLKVLK